jgi:hypothetical protein
MWFHFKNTPLFLPHPVFYSVWSQETLVHTAEPGHGFLIKRHCSASCYMWRQEQWSRHTLQACGVTPLQVTMRTAPTITGPYCKRKTDLYKITIICHLTSLDRKRSEAAKHKQHKTLMTWVQLQHSRFTFMRSWVRFSVLTPAILTEVFCYYYSISSINIWGGTLMNVKSTERVVSRGNASNMGSEANSFESKPGDSVSPPLKIFAVFLSIPKQMLG